MNALRHDGGSSAYCASTTICRSGLSRLYPTGAGIGPKNEPRQVKISQKTRDCHTTPDSNQVSGSTEERALTTFFRRGADVDSPDAMALSP